jgi:hypothetical protein
MPAIALRARSCLGAALFLFALGSGPAAFAQSGRAYFLPNNLLLSRAIYDNKRSNVVVGRALAEGEDAQLWAEVCTVSGTREGA